MKRSLGFLSFSFFIAVLTHAQPLNHKSQYNRQDSLRGSLNSYRTWWDVLRYDISVTPDFNSRSINGTNTITIMDNSNEKDGHTLQLDLQDPMRIESVSFEGKPVN